MKIRHRIKFAVDNMLLHSSQMRIGIIMNFFTFLILGIVIFLYNTTGSFEKETEKTITTDSSNVGYISLESENYENDYNFVAALKTQDYIKYSGSIYTVAVDLGDEVNNIQANNKRDSDTAEMNGNIYSEMIWISQSLFGLYDIELYDGYKTSDDVISDGYIPVYAGYKLKKVYDIGDTFTLDDGTYMIAGFIKRNQSLPVDDLASISEYYINATTSLDTALIEVSDDSLYYSVYFSIKEDYGFDDVKYRLGLLAERENVDDISIVNVGSVILAADNSTKSVRKYLLELLIIVGLSACVTLACYQSINILTRKYEYGIFYATGFNKADMLWIIVIESVIKVLIAAIIAMLIIALPVKLYFEISFASGLAFDRIIYKDVLGGIFLAGLIITIASTAFPIRMINKNSPRELMADKIVALMLLTVIVFTGCGQEEISYETDIDDVGSVLEQELSVPDSCTYEFVAGEGEERSISLDTENIVLPDTDELPSVYYEKNTCDAEYKRNIAEGIFDKEDGIYVFDGKTLPSDVLTELEAYYNCCIEKSEEQGDDNAYEIYEELLEDVEEQLKSADKPEATGDYEASEYIGYINGVSYLLSFDTEYVGFELSIYPEEFTASMIAAEDMTYAYLPTSYGDATEQDLINTGDLNVAKISSEEAYYEAYEFLEKLGITDVTDIETAVNEWDCCDLIYGQNEWETVYDGYYITFTDEIDNVTPYIGYYDWVTSLSSNGEYEEGKTISTYEICINDNGIISASCHDNYVKSTAATRQNDLLSWEEILDAASSNIEAYYSDKNVPSDICFNYVCLSYYEVMADDNTYELKPVWFFLSLEDQMLDYDMTMYPDELLIIDAVTGEAVEVK